MNHVDGEPVAIPAPKFHKKTVEFLGLATMLRIVLMEYLNMNKFFNMPDADMKLMLETVAESPLGVKENE